MNHFATYQSQSNRIHFVVLPMTSFTFLSIQLQHINPMLQNLLAADSSLGRMNESMLSDAMLLELMLSECSDWTKESYQNHDGQYKDLAEWDGVILDEDGRVTKFHCSFLDLSGTMSLDYIPRNILGFDISYNSFRGTVMTSKLPPKLERFDVGHNSMSGSIDFRSFPESLTVILVNANEFSGSVDLTSLPLKLQNLRMSANDFSGSVDLTALPETLRCLSIAHNQLSGSVDISKLPSKMEEIQLQRNHFEGELDVAVCPGQSIRIGVEKEQDPYDVTFLTINSEIYNFKGSD